jgi:2-C-methyl-D-erythritol 4-phosphate cytidylyltransferase
MLLKKKQTGNAIKTSAIIAGGGKGKRMQAVGGKQLLQLNGKPIIIRTIEVFDKAHSIDEIIVVLDKTKIALFEVLLKNYGIKKVKKIVDGGEERTDSVMSGLSAVSSESQIVVIHDGARPLITTTLIDQCVNAAKKFGAVVAAVPVKDTIKNADKTGNVDKTLPRQTLWHAQTPQAFKKQIIVDAYKKVGKRAFTDDSSVVEASGKKVKIIMGDYKNIKITTPEDLNIAEVLIQC